MVSELQVHLPVSFIRTDALDIEVTVSGKTGPSKCDKDFARARITSQNATAPFTFKLSRPLNAYRIEIRRTAKLCQCQLADRRG